LISENRNRANYKELIVILAPKLEKYMDGE
jgi:hypothetical protein